MAGFGSFFTSLANIFNTEYYAKSETVVEKKRNSAVADTSLSDKRIEASQNQASDQSRTRVDAADQARKAIVAMEREKRVEDAHRRIEEQTRVGRTAVIYSKKNNPVELRLAEFEKQRQKTRPVNGVTGRKRERDDDQNKSAPLSNPGPNQNPLKKQKTKTTTPSETETQRLKDLATTKFLGMNLDLQKITLKNHGFDNSALKNLGFKSPKEAIKQMRRWTKEAAEQKKLTEEGPPRTKVRKSVKDDEGKNLQEGEVRNIPLMKFQEEKAMEWWRAIARKALRSKDVGSVTIGKNGTLTREEAVQLGFIRDQNGGGRNGGGGR